MADQPVPAASGSLPPQPSITPGAPAPPLAPAVPSPLFVAANGPRHTWLDAFHNNERFLQMPKAAHPVQSYYNVFTTFKGVRSIGDQPVTPPASAAYRSYATGHALSDWVPWTNPLRLADVAKILPQRFEQLNAKDARTKEEFERIGVYAIFVPAALQRDYKSKPKRSRRKARLCLFFVPWEEMVTYGLRFFFNSTDDSVLITIPGHSVHDYLRPHDNKWGIGITKEMIDHLFKQAGFEGMEYAIEVIASSEFGYRGLNETVINQLVDLSSLKRMAYFDGFDRHDDFPLPKPAHPFYKKNTLWAAQTALNANPKAELWIYAYAYGDVPRIDNKGTPRGPLAELKQQFVDRVRFIDLELEQNGQRKRLDEMQNICMARMIQSGLDDYFEEKDVDLVSRDILPLVRLLPERGSLGVNGRPGFTSLFDWIAAAPQKDAIAAFPAAKAFALIDRFKFKWWTDPGLDNFRSYFGVVPEIGKECLLP